MTANPACRQQAVSGGRSKPGGLPPKAAALTAAAMLAFAGNSLLCRLALRDGAIDPATFTAVRLAAGAAVLYVIVGLQNHRPVPQLCGSRWSALMLFTYAAAFSFAYLSLDAATGALLLFGFVQITIIATALYRGEQPTRTEWAGWLLAMAGLTLLLLPGAGTPSLRGAILMAIAGIAWGFYTLRGTTATSPLRATMASFVLALPFILLLLPFAGRAHSNTTGFMLALASGALTSGLGYVLWYAALRSLRSMQAALVQLSVPAIAAVGGVALLGERLSARLLLCGMLILGGILLAMLARGRRAA